MSYATIRKDWNGFSELADVFIFGDSFSAIMPVIPCHPEPTQNDPLGFQDGAFTMTDGDNWVGHLAKLAKQRDKNHHLFIYDYAKNGADVKGVHTQFTHWFLIGIGKPIKDPDSDEVINSLWSQDASLFITWVGTNDLGNPNLDIDETLNDLFNFEHELYDDIQARNFMLIDVPPIERSPGGQRSKLDGSRYREWNKKLREKLKEFTDSHTEASTFLFSSFETFNRVLDDPTSFGFDAKEATKGCGQIWWDDNIHPTTKLYKIIAEDIIDLLNDPPRSV